MQSSGIQFPKEQFLAALRTEESNHEMLLKQVQKHNIDWIYESIKYIHNVLIDSRENPLMKINALKLIRSYMQTCQISCFNLIEVYILPILFSIAAYKPQQNGERRGFRFFIDNGFSPRIPDIEQMGIDFVTLASQLIFVCSKIRTKRTLECEELNQHSDFVNMYQQLKNIGVTGISQTSQMKHFQSTFITKNRQKYLKKLKSFEKNSELYTEYFVVKMIDSLETEQNILFSNTARNVSSLSNDLDFRKILKYGDTFLTSPLIQQLNDGLLTSQNFMVKKNFLSLLSDFVKWADIQAVIQITYEDTIDEIAIRIAEVNGANGFNEGEKIFPEIKGQVDGKKKFYLEFLKSIQVWGRLIKNNLQNEEESSKPLLLYDFLKNQKKFKFPENIILKKIEEDFAENQSFNRERNEKILQKLRLDQTSVVNNPQQKKSSIRLSMNRKSKIEPKKKFTFKQIQQSIENCFQDFDSLFDEPASIDKKMKNMLKFKENFDHNLEEIDQDPEQAQLLEAIDDGDALMAHIGAIQPHYKAYKQNKLTLEEFMTKFQQQIEKVGEQSCENFTNKSNSMSQNSSRAFSKKLSNSLNRSKSSATSNNKLSSKLLNKKLQKKDSLEAIVPPHLTNPHEHRQSSIHHIQEQYRIEKQESYLVKHSLKQSKTSKHESRSIYSNASSMKGGTVQNEKQGYSKIKEKLDSVNHERNNDYKKSDYAKENKSHLTNQKSKMRSIINNHRLNRSNQSEQIKNSVRNNSFTQNDFSRDIRQAVQKDLIVTKKIGTENDSNLMEKVNEIIKGDESKKSSKISLKKKTSLIKSKHSQKSINSQAKQSSSIYQSINKGRSQNDDYMMRQGQQKPGHPLSSSVNDLKKDGAVSMGVSSKLKLKKEISKLSKVMDGAEYHKRKDKQKSHLRSNYSKNGKSLSRAILQGEDHYQMRSQMYEEQPMKVKKKNEESYYGIQQMQPKQKKQKKQFKDCFQVEKTKKIDSENRVSSGIPLGNQYAFYQRQGSQPSQSDYQALKLRRNYIRQKDDDLRGIESRIVKLRSETSRIRRDLSSRSKGSITKRSQSNNSSRSREQDFARSEKSQRFSDSVRSISRGKSSHTSKQSIKSVQGRSFKIAPYEQYFHEISSNFIKKTMLKPKTLLHSDQKLEIGAICRNQDTLKIILFLTPAEQIHELRYKISEQMALSFKNYPDYYPVIPEKKQVKINLIAELKTMPFSIPFIHFTFIHRGKPKSISITLPCPPHRFIQFESVNPGEILASFAHDEGEILRTEQFKVNKSIFKIQKIGQYFQNLTLLKRDGGLSIYGVEGYFKRESFALKIITKGTSRIVIQGIPKSRPEFLEYLISSLHYIIAQAQ